MKVTDIQVRTLKDSADNRIAKNTWSFVSVLTDSGIEGNYATKPWVGEEIKKRVNAERDRIIGIDPLERSEIEKLWSVFPYMMNPSNSGVLGSLEICLWDIAGKYFNVPVYKLLGQKKSKILAYASVPTLQDVEAYTKLAVEIKRKGFKAIKIHPPQQYEKDIAVCKAVREAVGEDFLLMLDSVSIYSRREALKVGRELDRLNFLWYEDPLPSTDIDGLEELCRSIDTEVLIGERITSIRGYTEYIRRHATDALRCSAEQIGGISSAMKVAHLAECFGMNCEPHSWGHVLFQAASLHAMLAMNNCFFFELPMSEGVQNIGMKEVVSIDNDGYVRAPQKAGLGFELDSSKFVES